MNAVDSILTDQYWSDRYANGQTGWDTGAPTTPLKEYIDQITNKDITILIPGCGNAYEAAYLADCGFTDITLIDISAALAKQLKEKFVGTNIKIIHGDFFHHIYQYDLILEQTFFCALDPVQRKDYAEKMYALLKPAGKLAGVLFNKDFEGGPPFSGNKDEYQKLFAPLFSIKTMEPCYNSIKPREGTELFIIFEKLK
jgi:methyl halide transferase